MIARLLRRLALRRSASKAERLEAMRADLDRQLAVRRQGRQERNARSRKSAATSRHAAFERDALRNEPVTF